ncbi:methyltransferase domain-containing protein [Micromonospora halophytica]|uniref:27-O-demethylrifamycin SV methyltransferase n=1 Tax=Micromonospora halophytica TaxID=47864 RepID=A0A1C5HJR5_9ACTN|nr:methyltransferase domain-containing protein [Micromonospora halophytica]SCG46299.1 27-O-demethylrifamycin SV methyltransferase [Micromonospora halophytica]
MTKPTPSNIGQAYDNFADLLDQLWGENLHHGYWNDSSDDASFEVATSRLTDKLAGLLTIEPGDRLLDIGCGIGEPAIRLATAHDIVGVGISIAKGQVERANDRAAAAGLADRLSFQFADAMELPFPDESFDVVWALESLHHMPDRWQVVREAARVLRPGGRLAIGDFLLRSVDGTAADASSVDLVRTGVLKFVDIDEYQANLRAVGLLPEAIEDVSDHTRPSWAKAAERFEAARDLAEQHIGAEQFGVTLSRFRQFADEPAVGYVLLTARKPG